MKDQDKRKHQRNQQQQEEDSAAATTAAVRENERLAERLRSTVEMGASSDTAGTSPHPKRHKSASAVSSSTSPSSRTATVTASVLETTATPPSYEPPTSLLLDLNQKLLTSIAECNYETYDSLCADDMVCMEPESRHQVVVGKDFHKYYFDVYEAGGGGDNREDTTRTSQTSKVTMSQPHFQWLGGTPRRHPMVAVLSYVRLTQTMKDNEPVTIRQSESRVWELTNGKWKNVHFQKSEPLS